jgi:hypothetical protein
MSQHLLVAFLFLMALWEAGAVLGHVGLSAAWGPSQLTHLIGLSEGCARHRDCVLMSSQVLVLQIICTDIAYFFL